GAFGQRIGEALADLAFPVDVGLDGDRLLRARDRLQHRREDLRPVLQVGDMVAGQDRGAEHHRHLELELRVGDGEAMLDLAFELLGGGGEIQPDDDRQGGQQEGDDDGGQHSFPAPAHRANLHEPYSGRRERRGYNHHANAKIPSMANASATLSTAANMRPSQVPTPTFVAMPSWRPCSHSPARAPKKGPNRRPMKPMNRPDR